VQLLASVDAVYPGGRESTRATFRAIPLSCNWSPETRGRLRAKVCRGFEDYSRQRQWAGHAWL